MARRGFFSKTIPYILLLLVGWSVSQSCWYPDRQTQAQADVPCDPNADVSACCGPNAFCLANGLCYIDGAVSQGSCTDKNWGPDCANVCTDVSTDTGIALQPCETTQNTFVCGIYNSSCADAAFTVDGTNTIVLRPDQVHGGNAQMRRINPTSTFAAQSSEPASTGSFSAIDMVGVGVGIGVPLLAALAATVFIAISQRRKIRALKPENKLSKNESGYASPAYAQPVSFQPPNTAYGGFEYQPLTSARPQGHFQEVVPMELDGRGQPQELASAKPRY